MIRCGGNSERNSADTNRRFLELQDCSYLHQTFSLMQNEENWYCTSVTRSWYFYVVPDYT